MKTYEEMARDVLKRRDEVIQKTASMQTIPNNTQPEIFYPTKSKKSKLVPLIAVPCAAAIAVGAVTVGTRYNGLWGNSATESEVSAAGVGNAALTDDPNGETQGSAMLSADPITKINILDDVPEYLADHEFVAAHNAFDVDYNNEISLTVEEANDYFGVELDRLGKVHTNWVEKFTADNYMSESDNGKIGKEWCFLSYKYNGSYPGVPDVWVIPRHVGVRDEIFSPFDSSVYGNAEDISYVRGRRAIIFHNSGKYDDMGKNYLSAIIDYGDTLVGIMGYQYPEDEFVDILLEFTAPDFSNDKQNDIPHDDVINLLDTVPDYMSTHSFFNGYSIEGLTVQIQLTRDELNSYFGVETNRLGRLHPDWNAIRADGDFVTLYNGEVTDAENSGNWMIGGRKVVVERSSIGYNCDDEVTGADILIQFEHVGFRENSFSPFDSSAYSGKFSPDNFSYINGRKALVFYHKDEDRPEFDDYLVAIIDYGDTLVRIYGFELTADEFTNILDEYTSPEYDIEITPWSEIPQERFAERIAEVEATDNAVHSITILEDIPDFLLDHAYYKNVDLVYPQYEFPLTNEEMNSWFGVELDRLGRLHSDWEAINGGRDGIYGHLHVYGGNVTDAENMGGLKVCGRKAVWEINGFAYDFKDGGYRHDNWDKNNYGYDVTVGADHIGVLNDYFDPFSSSVCPDQSMISYLNGKKALIYHRVETGYNAMRAHIKYGQTIVTIDGFDLTEHEFLEIVDEFTKPDDSVTITPWEDIPQDKFAEIISTTKPRRLPEV